MMKSLEFGVRSLAYRHTWEVWSEKWLSALVWKLPRRLVYWAFIRVWANATTGQFGSTDATAIKADDCLRRWERGEGGDHAFATIGNRQN